MNLLNLNFEPFDLLTATRTDDSQGGGLNTWSVGGTFDGVAVSATSTHANPKEQTAKHAEAATADPAYTILTKRAVLLPFHAVVRRAGDGMIFRVMSDAKDAKTPKGSRLDLRILAAEKWRLPDGDSWAAPETPSGENSSSDTTADSGETEAQNDES